MKFHDIYSLFVILNYSQLFSINFASGLLNEIYNHEEFIIRFVYDTWSSGYGTGEGRFGNTS